MELEISHLLWNVILTLVVLPLAWWVRNTHDETRDTGTKGISILNTQ